MSSSASRGWRIAAALAGAAWALFLLPPQAVAWLGSGTPLWLARLDRSPFYQGVHQLVEALGGRDTYLVFGALSAVSFLAIGLALLPDLARLGWVGKALAWVTIAGAPITVLSYLNHSQHAPMHFLWGAEGLVLVLAAVLAVALAITARGRWPLWMRIILALTPVILAGGVMAFTYWPHGPLVALGVEAAVLIAGAPAQGGERRPDH